MPAVSPSTPTRSGPCGGPSGRSPRSPRTRGASRCAASSATVIELTDRDRPGAHDPGLVGPRRGHLRASRGRRAGAARGPRDGRRGGFARRPSPRRRWHRDVRLGPCDELDCVVEEGLEPGTALAEAGGIGAFAGAAAEAAVTRRRFAWARRPWSSAPSPLALVGRRLAGRRPRRRAGERPRLGGGRARRPGARHRRRTGRSRRSTRPSCPPPSIPRHAPVPGLLPGARKAPGSPPASPCSASTPASSRQQLQERIADRDSADRPRWRSGAPTWPSAARRSSSSSPRRARTCASTELQLEVPEDLVAAKELAVAADRPGARRARDRLPRGARSACSTTRPRPRSGRLRRQRDRAAARVREIREQLARMQVAAPRAGVVIYAANWQDEKPKVGDTIWRGSAGAADPRPRPAPGRAE